MTHRFTEWRISLLTTLGLGAALGCGGAANGGDGAGGEGAGASGGSVTAGQTSRAGEGGRSIFGGTGGATNAGATHGGMSAGGAGAVAGMTAGGSPNGGATVGVAGAHVGGRAWVCQNPTEYAPSPVAQDRAPQGALPTEPLPIPAPPPANGGFIQCDGGWLHRPAQGVCPSYLPRAADVIPPDVGGACKSDADCTEKPLGFCTNGWFLGGYCEYGCTSDAQCGEGTICVCGDPVGVCASASCTTNADCVSGICAGTPNDACGAPRYTFACATAADACLSHDDCPENQDCTPQSDGRQCRLPPVCGRPFLVDGHARMARATFDEGGWQTRVHPNVQALDFDRRVELAAHYTKLGLMEHASVAAFARFMLELLSLGAPADLVTDTQRAIGDEIAHAELCFGLARAYGGQPVAPGPLPVQGALDARSRFEIVTTAFLEACIGETIAAVEARLALERARDGEVRRALTRIADDEAKHAELGWRFVKWALATSSAEDAAQLRRALADIVRSQRVDAGEPTESADAVLADHGLTNDAARARRIAFAELIEPLAAALAADTTARTADLSALAS